MDDRLLAEATAYAMQSGRMLTALMEDAIRDVLMRRRGEPPIMQVRLKIPMAHLSGLAMESARKGIKTERGCSRFPGLHWRSPWSD
jgi:hypothetical protein